MNTDDELLDVAGAVADGEAVDWGAAMARAGEAGSAADLRQLEVISRIAGVHRVSWTGGSFAAATESAPLASAAAGEPEIGRWSDLRMLEKLGSGSFGDVYRAWDPALDREVALKLLRSDRGGSETVREGQMLARVRHPNIMAIYGAAATDGRIGIWGELLRGRTLATMVAADGPMGAAEALVVGDAVCRALAAVHRAGLVHRDVKAENVIRESGGRIVLMDIGLGSAMGDTSLDVPAGTPLYLAPELFAGGRAGVGTDLYALGVLLFFLSTGEYPVRAGTIDGIAHAHAEGRRRTLHDLRPDLPAAFVHVVERAIAPDPRLRFDSAGAMLEAIAAAAHGRQADEPVEQRGWMATAAWVGAAAIASVAITASLMPREAPPGQPRLVAIEPPAGSRFSDSNRNIPALSPDGTLLAFTATDDATGRLHLWVHSLATASAIRVPDSERASTPFWAPDSQSLGFIDPTGSVVWTTREGVRQGSLQASGEPRGATWNAQGVLLYPKGARSGLFASSTSGSGEGERAITTLDQQRGELAHLWPEFLPGGNRFIFYVLSNDAAVRGVYLGSLDGRTRTRVAATDASAIASGSRLLYVKDGNLVSQAMTPDFTAADGAPVLLAERVAVNYDGRSGISADRAGTIAFLPAREDTELVWLDRSGAAVGRVGVPAARYRSPVISRDGSLIAVQRYRDSLSEIQVIEADTGRARPPLAHSADVQFPVWGPGRKLAYASIDDGRSAIYVRDFAGDGSPVRTYSDGADLMPTDWSRDGRHLLFMASGADREFSVWALPLETGAKPFPIRPGEGRQVSGRFSPDGRSVLYVRREARARTGGPPDRELWACDFPSGANPRLLAIGGIDPSWPSIDVVSFFDRAGMLTLLPPSSPSRGPAVRFRSGVNTPEASRNNYDWTSDGARLLVNKPLHDPSRTRIMVSFTAGQHP
jgi:serine/threonine protein kinase